VQTHHVAMLFGSFLFLLALLSLALPTCSFCPPRVSLRVGPLSQQRLCQMVIDEDKSIRDLIKQADKMHLASVRAAARGMLYEKEKAEHKFALALAEKDHLLKLAEIDHRHELELAVSYRHSELSLISKRYVCSGNSMFAFESRCAITDATQNVQKDKIVSPNNVLAESRAVLTIFLSPLFSDI